MKLILSLLLAIAAIASVSAAQEAAAADGVWLTDYQQALQQAKKTGHPILANFTGSDWCGWCKKLKAEVFDTKEFKEWATKNVVLLELDSPRGKPQSAELKKQNQQLAQQFGIQGYPTIAIIDATGKKIGELGYEEGGPSKWLAAFKKAYSVKAK